MDYSKLVNYIQPMVKSVTKCEALIRDGYSNPEICSVHFHTNHLAKDLRNHKKIKYVTVEY